VGERQPFKPNGNDAIYAAGIKEWVGTSPDGTSVHRQRPDHADDRPR
jgi:hypothetical protein